MNDMELFLNYGAVVKIRKYYRDDLYKFCKLIIKLGFLNEYIKYFLVNMEIVEAFNKDNSKMTRGQLIDYVKKMSNVELLNLLEESFCDTMFWHLVDINEGKQSEICLEYQYSKGFTFGKKQDYINYDETIKILSVDELIFACGKEDEFNLSYIETSFLEELKDDKELAVELTDFCEWYEWELVKYSNGLYNILDLQTEELVGYFGNEENENGSLRDCIERVFYRMVDYFTDEEEHEDLEYVEKDINTFIKLGKQYNLYNDKNIKYLQDWFEEEKKYLEKI